jgi:hypothetical protein
MAPGFVGGVSEGEVAAVKTLSRVTIGAKPRPPSLGWDEG